MHTGAFTHVPWLGRAALVGVAAPVPTWERRRGRPGGVIPVRRTGDMRRRKADTEGTKKRRGHRGKVSIPGAQRSCVSLRANWFCAAGERGSAGDSR